MSTMKPEDIAIGVTVVVVVIAVAAIICSCMHSRSSGCGSCSLEGAQARAEPAQIATAEQQHIAYKQRAISPARTHLNHAHSTTPSRYQSGRGMSAPAWRTRFQNVQGVNVDYGGPGPHVRDHGDSLRNEWSIQRRAHERRQGDGWGGRFARKVQSMFEAPRDEKLAPAEPFRPSSPVPMVSEGARVAASKTVGEHGQKLVPTGEAAHLQSDVSTGGPFGWVGGNVNSAAIHEQLGIDAKDGGWGGPYHHKPQSHK